MNMIERTQEVMLQLELSNVKQMLDITRGDIIKKCIDCEEYIRDAVGNCLTNTCREGQFEERVKQMQEALCKRCPLYRYYSEYKKQAVKCIAENIIKGGQL